MKKRDYWRCYAMFHHCLTDEEKKQLKGLERGDDADES